jgi:hypothetical protein
MTALDSVVPLTHVDDASSKANNKAGKSTVYVVSTSKTDSIPIRTFDGSTIIDFIIGPGGLYANPSFDDSILVHDFEVVRLSGSIGEADPSVTARDETDGIRGTKIIDVEHAGSGYGGTKGRLDATHNKEPCFRIYWTIQPNPAQMPLNRAKHV